MSKYEIYQHLHNVVLTAVDASDHPELGRFRAGLAGEQQGWQEPVPCSLPAAGHLDSMKAKDDSIFRPVLDAFATHHQSLFWEQSYTRQHGVVSDSMLAGYGFAEIMGKNGPLVSHSVRCGIGVWGPAIEYPVHRHDAEEIYVVLAGSATFILGDNSPELRQVDDVVFVSSGLSHGFSTFSEPLAVLYFWQGGDLRQLSRFS